MIDKLPILKPEDKFTKNLWEKIDQQTKSDLKSIYINMVFKLAIFIFLVSSLISVYLLNFNHAKNLNEVSIKLTALAEPSNIGTANLLIVYDLDKNLQAVKTDYVVKNDTLYIKLKPGNYKLVFGSTKYENIVVSQFKILNS